MSRFTFTLIMLMASPAWAEVTVDRDHFFSRCASLTNFELSLDKKSAVASGTSRIRSQNQQAINDIIDEWEAQRDDDLKRLAFILATARRESSGTWQPIREAPRCSSEECRERAIGQLLQKRANARGKKPRDNYAKPAANGQRYYGRGYIQLTGENNYRQADRRLGTGTSLYDNPDRVMEQKTAVSILVRGMLEGWFGNGKPLSYYLNETEANWLEARNNVNPRSPNKPITAASGREIYTCLRPLNN